METNSYFQRMGKVHNKFEQLRSQLQIKSSINCKSRVFSGNMRRDNILSQARLERQEFSWVKEPHSKINDVHRFEVKAKHKDSIISIQNLHIKPVVTEADWDLSQKILRYRSPMQQFLGRFEPTNQFSYRATGSRDGSLESSN